MRMNRQRNYYSVRKRICRKALAVLLIIGIPAVLFLFTFSIKKVEIVGSNHYTDQQIKGIVLQSRPDYNSVYLYLKYKFFTTPTIPFVEKVDVEMVNNHTVKINVYEKIVIGCVEFMGEYLYFDKDGIIVESSSNKSDNIPIVNGLQFNKIILHEKLELEAQKEELYDVILNLTKVINKNDIAVDEISFNNNYEVTLKCQGIKVLLGKKSYYDEVLSDLKNILIKAKESGINILYMEDYKKGTGQVIGRTKKTTE